MRIKKNIHIAGSGEDRHDCQVVYILGKLKPLSKWKYVENDDSDAMAE